MPYLQSLEQAFSVTWGKAYLWDVKMPDAPSPFNEWLPALSIDETLYDISEYSFQVGGGNYSVPNGWQQKDIRMVLYDDADSTLLNWFRNWGNSLGTGTTVKTLSEVVRPIHIARLNNQRQVINQSSFWVRPAGQLFFQGGSDSSIRTFNVSLRVCGIYGSST